MLLDVFRHATTTKKSIHSSGSPVLHITVVDPAYPQQFAYVNWGFDEWSDALKFNVTSVSVYLQGWARRNGDTEDYKEWEIHFT